MKSILSKLAIAAMAVLAMCAAQGCSDKKSYAELLEDENKAVNRFLADQKVIGSKPADDNFIEGADAPFYQIDEEGNLYMRVIKKGDGEMVEDNQLVYFRFTRYNLMYYTGPDNEMTGEGNSDNLEFGDTSFRYGNTTLESSTTWGSGIQVPLSMLPLGSEIELVVKSQFGFYSEISYVQPFLYHLRYYPSMI
ncbi:MAG: DUF4827 domain-containing protein [Paramuribaculum sp.]|nr:DUF4827 domain-containing protein [Paramuribaculum sp.]